MRLTVLIVDDHAGFRAAARRLLEADGFCVVGEAANGEEALAAVERVRPQVVLLDVQLPGADGFAVAERLAREGHSSAIVLISSRDSAARDPRFATTAARGFIPRSRLSGTSLAELLG